MLIVRNVYFNILIFWRIKYMRIILQTFNIIMRFVFCISIRKELIF